MKGDAGSGSAGPDMADEWGSAVASGDATKLAELVLLWSGLKPERALSILRNCVSLLEKEVAFSAPASSPVPHGRTRNSCLNALIVAMNETCDGKGWYTSIKELQLASLEFCIACRTCKTMHLNVDVRIPRRLLAAADALPPHPNRLGWTRVPQLRARSVTWNMPTAAELRSQIFAMTDVDCLEFGHAFKGSLDAVAWPQQLKSIDFCSSSFNQPLNLFKWPSSLHTITLGGIWNYPVEDVAWPPSLRQLTFGTTFNQPIERAMFPDSLQWLVLGGAFNQPVEDVVWPSSLTHLIFDIYGFFNQPIGHVAWPTSLQKLAFSGLFNQPVEGTNFPTSLEQLYFGGEFDHPIEQVAWPQSLQQVSFGGGFNQPIERAKFPPSLKELIFRMHSHFDQPVEHLAWPTSLEQLTFGEALDHPSQKRPPLSSLQHFTFPSSFNQPIEDAVWPDSLLRLVLGAEFNQPVDRVRWPASLQELTFGLCYDSGHNGFEMYSNFNQCIGSSVWPASLRRLTLGHKFRQSLQGLGTWMPNLETFRILDYDSSDDSLLRGIEWPKGLRHLTVSKESNLDGVVVPSTVEVLHLYNDSYVPYSDY